jgi:choline kinase
MKAIILAAGVGNRLGADGKKHPKCLLAFDGKTLLQRHIEHLQGVGIEEIVIGVGYQAELVSAHLREIEASATIRTVLNPDFTRGSVISLWCLRSELDCGADVLVMDADVLYHRDILRALVDTSVANCFLLDQSFEAGDEPVKLCVRDGLLVEFRKQLSPDLAYEYAGESVGFFRFNAPIAQRLARRTEHYQARDALHDEHYEEAIRDLLLESPGDFGFEDITGTPWLEIDFPEDVLRAREQILPNI